MAWQDRAACRFEDPEMFVEPVTYGPRPAGWDLPAKRVCIACDVADQCLAEAIAQDDRDTIRGGLTPRERAALRRSA